MSPTDPQPARLGTKRAKQMLQDLVDAPFVVLAFTDGQLKVYAKGLDEEAMQKVNDLVEDLADE